MSKHTRGHAGRGPTGVAAGQASGVPDALMPLSTGNVRLRVRPVADLRQLDVLTATLLTIRQVESVVVDAVAGESVHLTVALREPLSVAGQLRGRLGSSVVSVRAERDHLVVQLDPSRSWLVEPPAPDVPVQAPVTGGRAVAPLVPDHGAPPAATGPRPAEPHAPERRVAGRHDLAADVLARNVLDAIPDTSVLVLDAGMRLRAVAGTALTRRGQPREVLLGRHGRKALPVLPWDVIEPACTAALHGDASACEFETLDHAAVFEATVSPVRDPRSGTGAVVVLRDVTARRRDAAVIADADEMFELSFARAPIGKAIVAPDGRFLKVNEAFCRLLGHDETALLRRDFRSITHPDDLDTDEALLRETLDGLRDGYVLEKRYLHAEGHVLRIQLSVALVRETSGAPRWLVAQAVDVTRHRRLEEELRSGTEEDGLTGLWNRSRLDVELGLRAQESRRYGVGASLLSIDLDGFAGVDATLGRERGDAFLRTVANAIRASVRDCDHCAHPGEDEFVVLLPHTPAAGAAIVADRIAEALRGCDAPGLPPGFLRASIGVAELVPGMTGERWLWHAEEACRVAKRAGGGRAVHGTGPEAAVAPGGASAATA
ncbi:sensor domain-containing diguanylate cyclase [Patulibacter minatonensis]|uniref:sensor domain-containing diguanylate cyclase n=1 Tax=Patulibacter minatonensis TaxID=298163 RepID=UPI0004B20246|nr:sensor domain-containing diguanylate cyclase [Patulibacter minatonensis]